MDKRGLASSNPISTRMDVASNHVGNNNSNKGSEHNANRHDRRAFVPNPSNGKQYHGHESSDLSFMSSSHRTDNQMRSNFGAQSSAQIDGSPSYRRFVGPAMSQESTPYTTSRSSIPSRSEIMNETPSLTFDSTDPTLVRFDKAAYDSQNIDHSSLASGRMNYHRKSRAFEVSVPLITRSECTASQNPIVSKEPVLTDWFEELMRYWCKIENETKSFLQLVKQDWIRENLAFDDEFERRFMKRTLARMSSAYKQFWSDEFFGDTVIHTDTDKRNHVSQTASCNGNVHDNESVNTFIHQQNQRSTVIVRRTETSNHDQHTANSSDQRDSIGQSKNDFEDQQSASQFPPSSKSKPNSNDSYCNPGNLTEEQTLDTPTNQIESTSTAQQRMELIQNGEQQLSSIAEGLENLQHSKTILPNDTNDVIAVDPDDDLELTLTNGDAGISHDDQQIQPVSPSDTNIHANPIESSVDGIGLEVFNDCEYEQDVGVEPASGEKVSDMQVHEVIDLISDQGEEVVNYCENGDSRDKKNTVGQLQQVNQRRKRKNSNATTNENLKKRLKMTNAVDTKKRHKCRFCEYSTDIKSSLTHHIRTHTDERPFGCEVCKKRFTQKGNLNTHMKTHRDMFAFHCLNCHQGFSDENQRKSHESHCKAKGYECYLCNKKFYYHKSNLLKHMRHKHTGEKPFGCAGCSKRFCQKSDLTSHMKRRHKELPN